MFPCVDSFQGEESNIIWYFIGHRIQYSIPEFPVKFPGKCKLNKKPLGKFSVIILKFSIESILFKFSNSLIML